MSKKYFLTILLASAVAYGIFLSSCSTEVDLLEDYEPITVVYCLLNTQDNTQYIKVNKAFLGEGNALVMAQQSDSSNYQPGTIDVTLEKINPSTGAVLQTITCDTTTQVPKDGGTFSNPYQLLFYTNTGLDAGSNYKLVVRRHEDDAVITATSPIVGNVTITAPITTFNLYSSVSTYSDQTIKWSRATNAKIYNVVVRFTYYQSQISPPGPVDTVTLDYNLGSKVDENSGASFDLKLEGERYFQFLGSSIVADNNMIRTANDSLSIIMTAGAEDFYTYVLVNEPSIGLIQEKPVFTNITNGTGIFSSRWSRAIPVKMNPATLNELHNGAYTGQIF